MNLQEVLTGGGISLFILLALIQIAPVKINPWGALARWIGKAINGEVLDKLGRVEKRLDEQTG